MCETRHIMTLKRYETNEMETYYYANWKHCPDAGADSCECLDEDAQMCAVVDELMHKILEGKGEIDKEGKKGKEGEREK